jgi:hypothetical protein
MRDRHSIGVRSLLQLWPTSHPERPAARRTGLPPRRPVRAYRTGDAGLELPWSVVLQPAAVSSSIDLHDPSAAAVRLATASGVDLRIDGWTA